MDFPAPVIEVAIEPKSKGAQAYIQSKVEGGRQAAASVNDPPAGLHPHDARDRRGDPPRGHRDGHAG
ncbi:hypothetical protein SFUMM280S_06552 [Streptomyces fumanus]